MFKSKREARLILNVKRELDVNPVFTGLMFHWPPNGGEAETMTVAITSSTSVA